MSLPGEKVGQVWKAPRKLTPISKDSIACLIVTAGGGCGVTADGCGGTDEDGSTTMALSSLFVEAAVGRAGMGNEAN